MPFTKYSFGGFVFAIDGIVIQSLPSQETYGLTNFGEMCL